MVGYTLRLVLRVKNLKRGGIVPANAKIGDISKISATTAFPPSFIYVSFTAKNKKFEKIARILLRLATIYGVG